MSTAESAACALPASALVVPAYRQSTTISCHEHRRSPAATICLGCQALAPPARVRSCVVLPIACRIADSWRMPYVQLPSLENYCCPYAEGSCLKTTRCANHCSTSWRDICPAATAKNKATISSSVVRSFAPFSSRKISATAAAMRLLPSRKAWAWADDRHTSLHRLRGVPVRNPLGFQQPSARLPAPGITHSMQSPKVLNGSLMQSEHFVCTEEKQSDLLYSGPWASLV